MKAAQYYGPNDIRVLDVPAPEPADHEALVAIEWCGICGSDLNEYVNGPMACPPPSRPHPLTKQHIPVTLGHEFAGRIIRAPSSSGLAPGTPVVVDPRIFCHSCSRCKAGSTQGCVALGFKGLSGSGGGFSETVAVDASLCHALPADVDLSLAALVEPLAVAWHAIVTAELKDWESKSVLVVGGGPVGVAVIVVLRAFGCKNIIVSEPTTVRAEQIEKIADVVLNPIKDDVSARCRDLTGGEGVDVVFDCAGNQKGLEAGMDAVRFRGLYMNVAVWFGKPMEIPFQPFFVKEVTIKSCVAYNDEEFKGVVDAFAAGKFKGLENMVTSKVHIDEIVSKGFDELITNRDQHVKILITPNKLET